MPEEVLKERLYYSVAAFFQEIIVEEDDQPYLLMKRMPTGSFCKVNGGPKNVVELLAKHLKDPDIMGLFLSALACNGPVFEVEISKPDDK